MCIAIPAQVVEVRDASAVRHFPDDEYDLVICSYADIHPSLAEPGIVWGAAKAHVHLARRRPGGGRPAGSAGPRR